MDLMRGPRGRREGDNRRGLSWARLQGGAAGDAPLPSGLDPVTPRLVVTLWTLLGDHFTDLSWVKNNGTTGPSS